MCINTDIYIDLCMYLYIYKCTCMGNSASPPQQPFGGGTACMRAFGCV